MLYSDVRWLSTVIPSRAKSYSSCYININETCSIDFGSVYSVLKKVQVYSLFYLEGFVFPSDSFSGCRLGGFRGFYSRLFSGDLLRRIQPTRGSRRCDPQRQECPSATRRTLGHSSVRNVHRPRGGLLDTLVSGMSIGRE